MYASHIYVFPYAYIYMCPYYIYIGHALSLGDRITLAQRGGIYYSTTTMTQNLRMCMYVCMYVYRIHVMCVYAQARVILACVCAGGDAYIHKCSTL